MTPGTQSDSPHLLCYGIGYCAARLVPRLLDAGWRVSGTTRTADRAALLRARYPDVPIHVTGESGGLPASVLTDVSHLLISAAPTASGDPFCAALTRSYPDTRLSWIGYLSSTGVYGDTGGDWVDEETIPRPGQDRTKRRLAAENQWRAFGQRSGVPVTVFRLAGIYGPGRSVLDRLSGALETNIVRPGHVFSRIHVDDIAVAIQAVLEQPDKIDLVNCSDDCPEEPSRVIDYACELIGMPPLPRQNFEEAWDSMSPMARSFWAEHRRVRNDRLKALLGGRLTYPSYREGLRAILTEMA